MVLKLSFITVSKTDFLDTLSDALRSSAADRKSIGKRAKIYSWLETGLHATKRLSSPLY
jgi:hypothetical protein